MVPFSRFANYFLEVARQGSLRKAAEVLHVSASAIDRQLLQAEETLATALFERLPNGLKLTAAGELMVDDLRRWRRDHARTLERLADLKGLKRGHVSIAVIAALGEGMVTRTVAAVGRQFPGLTFDLRVMQNHEVAAQIGAAEVDIGLMLDPAEHPSLEVRASVGIPIGMAMPVDHPLAGETKLSLTRTLAYRHIVPAAPLIVHAHAARLYARHRLDAKQPVACNDVRMMCSLIRAGAGIGMLSLLDVVGDVEDGRLAFVPLESRVAKPLTLALCVAPRRQLSRPARLLIERVAGEMRDVVSSGASRAERAEPARIPSGGRPT